MFEKYSKNYSKIGSYQNLVFKFSRKVLNISDNLINFKLNCKQCSMKWNYKFRFYKNVQTIYKEFGCFSNFCSFITSF